MNANVIVGSIFMAIIMFAIVAFIVVVNENGKGNGTETYVVANDGGYIPVYRVSCTAERYGNKVYVIWDGNEYAAYVDEQSTIETGDTITATFIIYEGNAELVDIN